MTMLVAMTASVFISDKWMLSKAAQTPVIEQVPVHNVTETIDYTKQRQEKNRGLITNVIPFEYEGPEGISVKKEFENLSELRNFDFAEAGIGDYVKTKGYYSSGDSGGGVYLLTNTPIQVDGKTVKEDAGRILTLSQKLDGKTVYAVLQGNGEKLRVSAAQFGAVGDGVTDDKLALKAAFNSGADEVYLEKGKEYFVSATIWITGANTTVKGQGATLFLDNRSSGNNSNWDDRLVLLNGARNYFIENVRFEMRSTKYMGITSLTACYKGENQGFRHCEFYIPRTVFSEDPLGFKEATRKYATCCVTGYSGWKDMYLEDNIVENYADCYAGGCIGLNDIWFQGSKGAVVDNCYMSYNCKDEVIAIFSGSGNWSTDETYVKDVVIKNCDIYGLRGQYTRDMAFTIGYDDHPVSNIKYLNNHIESVGGWRGICVGKGATDVVLEGNEIVHMGNSYDAQTWSGVIDCGYRDDRATLVKNNKIYIPGSTQYNVCFIVQGNAQVEGNEIQCDADTRFVFGGPMDVLENKVVLNGECKGLTENVVNATENHFVVNSAYNGTTMFHQSGTLNTDRVVQGNTVELKNGVSDNLGWCNAFCLSDIVSNGHSVSMTENTITAQNMNDNITFSYLGIYRIPKEEELLVNFIDNDIDGHFDHTAGDSRENVTLEVKKHSNYQVSFDSQGGTPVKTQTVEYGEKAKEPSVSRKDYSLLGWYQEQNGQEAWDFSKDTISHDTNLYAKWIKTYDWKQEEQGTKLVKYDGTHFYQNEMVTYLGETYYFDFNGYRKTGLVDVNGETYYFDPQSGHLSQGFFEENGNRYYALSQGIVAKKQWILFGEEKYYALEDGRLATGQVSIDGKMYHFTNTGTLISSVFTEEDIKEENKDINPIEPDNPEHSGESNSSQSNQEENKNQPESNLPDSNENQTNTEPTKPSEDKNQTKPGTSKPNGDKNQAKPGTSKPKGDKNQTVADISKETDVQNQSNSAKDTLMESDVTQVMEESSVVAEESIDYETEIVDFKKEKEENENIKDSLETGIKEEESLLNLEERKAENQKKIIGILVLAGVLSGAVLFYAFLLIKRGK